MGERSARTAAAAAHAGSRLACGWLAAALAGLPLPARAADEARARFVYAGDAHFPPYDYLDSQGRPTGFDVELVRAVAGDAGVALDVRLGSWEQARADLDAGRADLISLSHSAERAEAYLWLGQTWTMHQCVLFPAGRAAYPRGPEELAGETIAVQERSAVAELLFGLAAPRPALVTTPTQGEALALLRRRVATGVGGNSLSLRIAAVAEGPAELVELPLRAVPYGLVGRKGRETELAWVERSLARVRAAGTLEALAERFLAVPVPARSLRSYALPAAMLLGFAVALAAGSFAWNRSLRRLVALRTAQQESTLRQREELARSLSESEDRFSRLAAASFEAIAITENGLFVDGNEQLAQMLGASVPELLGRSPLEFVEPEHRELVATHLASGSEEAYSHLARRRDGTVFPVEIRAKSIPYKGRTARVTALRDITERLRVEEALRASDREYRGIVDFSPVGIYRARPEGTIVTANLAFARILGYDKAEDVLGLDMGRDVFFEPGLRARMLERFVTGERTGYLEIQFKRRDGTPFWAGGEARMIRDAEGRLLLFEAFVQDISVRRAAQEALAASEERYRLLFEGNPLPMLIYDLESLRLLAVNAAAVRQYGYTQEELLALSITDLAQPGDPHLAHFLATRFEPRPDLVRLGLREQRRKDGTPVAVDLTSLVIRFDGRPARLILAADVTAERRLAALQDSLRRSETMAAMGALVAGVAHEVRNPLFSISATVDALAAELDGQPDFAEYAGLLRSQVARLTQLTRDLFDYGKPPRLQPAAVAPAELVRRALRACATLAGKHGVALAEDLADGIPSLQLDADRMEQVFENLIANGIQHSPKGACVRVVARLGRDPGVVELCVEDEGPGLQAADIPHLFEPFFSRRQGGTGLGLPIAQRIVEAHGGTLVAANRDGRGAVFTVCLTALAAPQAGGGLG